MPGEDHITSLAASIAYSISHLSPTTRRRLVVLSLFHGIADIDALGAFAGSEGVPRRFRRMGSDDWAEVLNEAVGVGLLTELGHGMYRIHPALPTFLAQQWRTEEGRGYDTQRKDALRALVDGYAALCALLDLDKEVSPSNASVIHSVFKQQARMLGHTLGYALDHGMWEQAYRIAGPLDDLWNREGLFIEADTWIARARQVLEDTDGTPPPVSAPSWELWVQLLNSHAGRLVEAGHHDVAEDLLLRRVYGTLRAQQATPDLHPALTFTYHMLGIVDEARGRLDQAEQWFQRVLDLNEQPWDQPELADTYHQLGIVEHKRGNLDKAEHWFGEELSIDIVLGNRLDIVRAEYQLGFVNKLRGGLDEAERWYRRSLAITEELGIRPEMAMTYGQLGLLAQERDNPDDALRWTIRAVTLFEDFPHPSTGPAPSVLATMARRYGIEAVERSWADVTREALPDVVRRFVEQDTEESE